MSVIIKVVLDFLLAILSNEERHEALSYLYDELINTRLSDMAVNKAVFRGEPLTIYAKSSAYHKQQEWYIRQNNLTIKQYDL